MSKDKLNIEYIREKTGLVENDELIPIILEMIKESFKSGLSQAEYDNTMELIEENQKYKEVIDKAIEKLQMLIDIGLDYDGFNQIDSLKTLIDEIVIYAKETRNILKEVE